MGFSRIMRAAPYRVTDAIPSTNDNVEILLHYFQLSEVDSETLDSGRVKDNGAIGPHIRVQVPTSPVGKIPCYTIQETLAIEY